MKVSRRLLILLAILGILAWLIVFDNRDSGLLYPNIVQAHQSRSVVTNTAHSTNRNANESSTLLALRSRSGREAIFAVAGFETRDWAPPSQPELSLPPPPPPPPQAPPLPFAYLGKQQKNGKWTVFLSNQERTYIVMEGMVIESAYRIEKITPPILSVTYLPLQQLQTLTIGATE
jgi:hypothetical protein